MCFLPLETTFNHKTVNLFKVLNIEISWRTITKPQNIFNANRATNVATVWIFCECIVPNKQKKRKMVWIFYNLIISKQGILSATVKNLPTSSDVSRVFWGRPVTSWSSPSPFPPPWLAEIFKPWASRCSKNALPGRACS